MRTAEHPLPAQPHSKAARKAEGFATPKEDKKPQCARFLPKRVLPIVFLPGIMGSNLKLDAERQRTLKQKNNVAWRPDSLGLMTARGAAVSTPQERQLRLDPLHTTVDIYSPSCDSDTCGDRRNKNVKLAKDFRSPLLMDDPSTASGHKTAAQKARARGWGEVYFGSYGQVLQYLESRLNAAFSDGKLRSEWRDVVCVDPATWHANSSQASLSEDELRNVVSGCWFPVHAFGYNWLQANRDSAIAIAGRINQLISDLNKSGYECNQVIVVTHSMGGLVGRALIHPDFGNILDKIAGMVHGVMPAIGAPAAYKRMRAGFEDPGIGRNAEESIGAKIAGNSGDEVTAVLANAQGGLELLPSEDYGNGWLRVEYRGELLASWPTCGDPYSEIYKTTGRWYSLIAEDWVNPSQLPARDGGGSVKRTFEYLDRAQSFHRAIANTYHPNSYCHYGVDRERRSYESVVWEINARCADTAGWREWEIVSDDAQGCLVMKIPQTRRDMSAPGARLGPALNLTQIRIAPPLGSGDQTVPEKSANHQLLSGQFNAVFRQTGYEHQSSYANKDAIASTLYSIVRIAQKAKWKC